MHVSSRSFHKLCAVLLMGLSLVSTGQAQDADLSEALAILLTAELVHDSGVGLAGGRSPLYQAFANLWHHDAELRANAERLIADGTPAAKVYGLLLLKKVNPDAAARAAEEVRHSTETVAVISGCEEMLFQLSELADRIGKDEHIIQLPSPPRRRPFTSGAL